MNKRIGSPLRLGALLGLTAAPALLAQATPPIFVDLSTSQISSGATPASATPTTIAAPDSGWDHFAAAPAGGTTWNNILRPNPLIGSHSASTKGVYFCNSANNIALISSIGSATGVTLTVSLDIQDLDSNTTRTEPNTGAGGATAIGPSGIV